MALFHKILREAANSADFDQTAPSGVVWSWSALFAYTIVSKIFVYEILGYNHVYIQNNTVFP